MVKKNFIFFSLGVIIGCLLLGAVFRYKKSYEVRLPKNSAPLIFRKTKNITTVTEEDLKKHNKPRIGILTSGGDCSGLNSIIYAACKTANKLGFDLIGFKGGVNGLINDNYVLLDENTCTTDLLFESGSIIKSDTKVLKDKNGKNISKDEGDWEIIKEYNKLELTGLIYIGGDGSIGMINNLLKKEPKMNLLAIPKTIDNDVANTDVSVGFSTVSNVVTSEIKKIIDTAKSHNRVMVIEVMGRAAGYIAITSGLASGADVILIPEIKFNFDKVIEKIKSCYDSGKNYAIVVVSEAVEFEDISYKEEVLSDSIKRKKYGGIAEFLAKKISEKGFDARSVVLGHLQRGGETTVEDRLLAQRFGSKAVRSISKGKTGCMLGLQKGEIKRVDLKGIKKITRELEKDDYQISLATQSGIYVGEIDD